MVPTRRADSSPLVRCAALMGRQLGLITRIQAVRDGLSERQIDHRLQSGIWRLVHPGVYAASEYPVDWHQRSLAACLWAGPPVALSHRSAALLWKLEGIMGSRVEITTPRRLADSTVVIHRSSLLKRNDITHTRGLPVTSVSRTLLDLAAVVPLEPFEIALDSALSRGLTSTRRLAFEIGAQARAAREPQPFGEPWTTISIPLSKAHSRDGSSSWRVQPAYPNPQCNTRSTPTASLSPESISPTRSCASASRSTATSGIRAGDAGPATWFARMSSLPCDGKSFTLLPRTCRAEESVRSS